MCHLAFARRLVKRNAGRCNRTPRLQVDAGCPVTARDIKHKTIETGSAGLLVLACFLSLSVASGCASKEGTVTREGRDAHVVEIGPEQIVLTDGLQVYMFQTSKGTLVAMAQLSLPPGYQLPERNVFPSIPGWIISRNQGKSWQRWSPKGVVPSSAYEPVAPGPRFEGTATELKDGTVMLLEWIADGPLPDGNWTGSLWESRDDCGTLQGPIPVTVHLPQAKTGYDDSGRPGSSICFHRPLVELPGGDLITPVYCLFKGDNTPVAYQPTMLKMRCVLLRSADRGRSWGYLSTIAVNPAVGQEGFDEPVMIRLSAGPKAGRLICVMRTGRDTHLYQTHSDDDGATWSEPHSIGLFGVDPDMIELSDGALVCGFLWRTGGDSFNPRAPVYLAVSKDQGDTWEDLIKFPQGQDPRFRRWSEYGGIREIAPGRLIVLYDVIPDGWTGTVRYVASREIRLPAPGDWRADASLEKNVLPTVGRKTMRVRRATAPLKLDGLLAEADWAAADTGEFVEIGMGRLEAPTLVRLLYDDQNIYVAFECVEPLIEKLESSLRPHGRDGDVYAQDCVEVFADPMGHGDRYYHFICSALPDSTFDGALGLCAGPADPLAGKEDASWNGDWSYVGRMDREEKRWSVEMAIPFKTLGVPPPTQGTRWKMNLGRERFVHNLTASEQPELSLWSPNMEQRSFHSFEAMGDVVFQ